MHAGWDNRRAGILTKATACLVVWAIAHVLLVTSATAMPGLSLPAEDEIHVRYIFNPPEKDTLTAFEPTFYAGVKLPPSRIDFSPWALDLDSRIVARADSLDYETYAAFRDNESVKTGWNGSVKALLRKSEAERRGELRIGVALPSAVESIVGEGGAGLKVSGYRKILFSGRSQWQNNNQSTASVRQSKFPSLSMEQISKFTVEGSIGSKITVKVDQDSKRTSDLENRIIIRYKGDQDDILQSVDLGNTTLSLSDARFIGYSERIQGLFGIGATAALGPIDLKMIASQEKGSTSSSRVTAGASEQSIIIRDYSYERYRYFDLGYIGRQHTLAPGDTIIEFDLFQDVGRTNTDAPPVRAYENWYDTTSGELPVDSRYQPLIWLEDYDLHETQHYLWFPRGNQRIENSALAYYMIVKRANTGIIDTVGELSTDFFAAPHRLQFLKRTSPRPTDPFWNAEWKNIYDLRIRDIEYEDLDLTIYKGGLGDEENPANEDHQSGTSYLRVLGLDSLNNSGGAGYDGRVDNIKSILDLENGLLIFPNRFPFADSVALDAPVPRIYDAATSREQQDSSKYYIKITTRQRSSQVRLNTVNILSGSEVVTYNGRRLNRGTDYDIDYSLGFVTLLKDEFLDPNANITIDYEYAPFLTVERRSLFGASATYESGANFRTGLTMLYKGTKATDRPAQLGQEPYRDIVGEYFLNWRTEAPILTRFADALPFVETQANSRIDFSGAVARSMPNPNTRGEVFIDDFEGAKRASSLGVLRESWRIASPPLIGPDEFRRSRAHPGFPGLNDPGFTWFNPYDQFDDTDIYERDETRVDARDRRTHVLILEFRPQQSPTLDSINVPRSERKNAWGGVMRLMPPSAWIQSDAEFIELRMAVATRGDGEPGVLHLDLGRISEDVNHNNIFDTEDRLDTLTNFRNRILDDGEDIGLDGLTDQEEVRWYDSAGYDPVALPDPAGDNWPAEIENAAQRSEHPRINGTDKNFSDPVVGVRPDTEDFVGSDSEFDRTNAYYDFSINLDVNEPEASRVANSAFSKSGTDPTGFSNNLIWYTYRIPLWDAQFYDAFGDPGQNPDSNNIQFARLWMEGADTTTRVYIASVDIVERTWETNLAQVDPTDTTTSFQLGVVNTEENSCDNPDTCYGPPPGVSGYRNPRTGFREKEQSLLLSYQNFRPGDTGTASISVTKEDYTGYRYLKMWVNHYTPTDSGTAYYVRFGQNSSNFYEYIDTLIYEPTRDGNWRQNEMSIDFDVLTALKDTKNRVYGFDTYLFDPASKLGVKGNPSLSNVSFRQIGIVRSDSASPVPNSGQVWFDELRLTDVRKDPGLAASGKLTVQVADLLGFSTVLEGRNYSFRGLTQGRTSSVVAGSNELKKSFNGNISVSKFLPEAMGISLPVSANYSKSEREPRLLTGSDIVLTPERRKQETSTTISEGVSTSLSIKPATNNWIVRSTIAALRLRRFSVSRTRSWTPTIPYSETERYDISADYSLQFGKRLTFPAMFWTRLFLFPRKIWNTPLSLLPTRFSAQGTVGREKYTSINNEGLFTDRYKRNFSGSMTVEHQPIPQVQSSYSMTTNRDLANPEELVLSFNPSKFKLGNETSFNQRFSSNYRTSLFPFLQPAFTYGANFRDNIDPQYRDHDVNSDRNWSVSGTFNLEQFWSSLAPGMQSRGGRRGPRRPIRPPPTSKRPSDKEIKSDSTKTAEPKPSGPGVTVGGMWRGVIGGFRFVTSPLGPLSVNYSESDGRVAQNLVERPGADFLFGFKLDQEFERALQSNQSASTRDTRSKRKNLSVKNSVNFLGILDFQSTYSRVRSRTQSGNSDPNFAKSVVFPQLSTSLSRLERVIPVKWFFSTASARFGYTRKNDESTTSNRTSTVTSENYSPLISLQGTTPQRIQLNFVLDRSSSVTENEISSPTKRTSRQVRISANYSFSSPNGIPLPFLRSIRLKSRMSIAVTVTVKKDESFNDPSNKGKFSLTQGTNDFTVSTRANYSFSTRVRGGLDAEWTDRNTRSTSSGNRKTHVRALGIWAEFSF